MNYSLRPTVSVLLLAVSNLSADTHYVSLARMNPSPPYTSWGTAATNIQDAVDVAVAGDEIVVTNGVYAVGGRAVVGTMTNRVAVDKPLTVRSLNGSQFTLIEGHQIPGTTDGDGAIRCVYLTNAARLIGFTLTNGATRGGNTQLTQERAGGAVFSESWTAVISNCVASGNSAAEGGAIHGGSVYDSILTNNAFGASSSLVSNCLLAGNGGSAYSSTLYNCRIETNGYGPNGCTVNSSQIL